jgi:hypothetical protein
MCNVPEVEYRDIPGFTGYRAGSDGTIWSCWKRGGGLPGMTKSYRQIHGRPHCKSGHIEIRLKGGNLHPQKYWKVHQLILWTFVGKAQDGQIGLHSNGKSSDNRISNLRWGTHRDNIHDAIRHGTFRGGKGQGKGSGHYECYARLVLAFGECKSILEWSNDSRCKVCYKTLFARIRYRKLDAEIAMTLGTKKGQVIEPISARHVAGE